MATRRVPVAAQRPFDTRPYQHRFQRGKPTLGLAAVKHEQAEQARRRVVEDFRREAKARRKRSTPNQTPGIRRSREDIRAEERMSFIAGLKMVDEGRGLKAHLELWELARLHLERGTLDQFLKSLIPR